MMGERTLMQEALFYEFSLERHVPARRVGREAGGSSTPLHSPCFAVAAPWW